MSDQNYLVSRRNRLSQNKCSWLWDIQREKTKEFFCCTILSLTSNFVQVTSKFYVWFSFDRGSLWIFARSRSSETCIIMRKKSGKICYCKKMNLTVMRCLLMPRGYMPSSSSHEHQRWVRKKIDDGCRGNLEGLAKAGDADHRVLSILSMLTCWLSGPSRRVWDVII